MDGGEWVPIRAAAARLGVSADTVRRRLRAGELPGEKRPGPQGETWYVRLPDDAPPAPPDAPPDAAVAVARLQAQVEGLAALADELRRERDAWREQAARSDEAAVQLRVLVQQAQALAQALPATTGGHDEAPMHAPARPAPAPGAAQGQDAGSRPRRPWWRFWE